MNIELINTGTELMLGRVLNTHQQWLCSQLAALGYVVGRQVAVPDTGAAIQQAVREALLRSNLIITTGGLGPTSDDVTRELIAELLGKTLKFHSNTFTCIENFFTQRKRAVPENSRKQAYAPEGAIILQNHFGTAPGLVMQTGQGDRGALLIMLPGPPRELRPMFTEQVVPLLRKMVPAEAQFVCRTLRSTGIGESLVEQKIDNPLQTLIHQGLELGYCARVGEVDVRLAARGAQAMSIVAAAEGVVRSAIGAHVYGIDEDTLESVVVGELARRGKTVAVAESCTGGLIAHRITNVPGASQNFMAGMVTYSNESKQRFLGVRGETLSRFGAVSEETAREMAEGARTCMKADFALAVTGIAGPSGGTAEKPVGTVFIGLAGAGGVSVLKNYNPYDREAFKFITSQQALELLRQALNG